MRLPLFLALLAALVAPLPAHAIEDPPLFLIESVSVEGAQYASEKILLAASQLDPGGSYSEAQLRDAIARVQRLPFVRHADFRLAKGSERGRYVLVIEIQETKPFFVSYRALHEGVDTRRIVRIVRDPVTGEQSFETEKVLFRHNEDASAIGVRHFVGSKGVVHGAVENRGGRNNFNAGYTQYDLFGTRASASVLLRYREYGFDLPESFGATGRRTTSFGDHLVWEINTAIPLFGNHALRAGWYRQTDPYAYLAEHPSNPEGQLKITRLVFDRPTIDWIYDTTNDPLFPTRGVRGSAGVEWRRDTRLIPGPGRTADPRYVWNHDYAVRATKYWELNPRHSISAGGEARTILDRQYQEYQLRAGYSASLLGREQTLRFGDLRFEVEAERNRMHYLDNTSHGRARAGLALRTSWCVARLDFQYIGWRQTP